MISPVIGTHPLRKSSGLRHPPSFPNILFFYLVAWVKISISTAPPLFGHQPYQTPPLGTSIPVTGHPLWHAHPLYMSIGPLVLGGLQLSFHCPPPGSIPQTIHSLSTAWITHSATWIHIIFLQFNCQSSRSPEMLSFLLELTNTPAHDTQSNTVALKPRLQADTT